MALTELLQRLITAEQAIGGLRKEIESMCRSGHIKLDELALSNRAINALRSEGIHNVADLLMRTEEELRHTPNIGSATMREIKAALGKLDLHFEMGLGYGGQQ